MEPVSGTEAAEQVKLTAPGRRRWLFGGLFAFVVAAIGLGVGSWLGLGDFVVDNPQACVRCHVMQPYYDGYVKGLHGQDSTCVQCHVEGTNWAGRLAYKAKTGMRHVYRNLTYSPEELNKISITPEALKVVEANCQSCHQEITLELNQGVVDGSVKLLPLQFSSTGSQAAGVGSAAQNADKVWAPGAQTAIQSGVCVPGKMPFGACLECHQDMGHKAGQEPGPACPPDSLPVQQ